MPLTKDDISDLRSLQDRVITCTLDKERADSNLKIAKSQLDQLLWRLEHEPAANKEPAGNPQPTPVRDQEGVTE